MRLMIVDDHSGVRAMLRQLIASDGDSVQECASGEEAVRLAPFFKPDAVTMDVRMPGMCGFEALGYIRRALPEVRVAIVTSYDEPFLRQAAEEAGAVEFFVKEDLGGLKAALKAGTQPDNQPSSHDFVRHDGLSARGAKAQSMQPEHFRLLVDNSLDVIAEIKPDGCCVFVSPNVKTVVGYEADEFVGTNVLDHVHPEDLPMVKSSLELTEGRVVCRYRHENGSWRWLETTGRDFTTATGECRTVLIARDITEQHESQTALKQSEERTRLMLEHSIDSVALVSGDGTIVGWNAQAERTFGWKPEEIIGRTLAESVVSGSLLEQAIAEAGSRDSTIWPETGSLRFEGNGRCRDGRMLPVELVLTLLPTSNGMSFSVLIRDLSSLQEAREAQSRMETQLRHAQKCGALGALAGGIAHDFNNMLGAILTYTELVRMQTADQAGVQDDLNQVLKAGERAKQLVQQILTFSRRETQELKPIYLHAVLGDALKLIRSTLPKSINIQFDREQTSAAILADTTQIYQVLLNLFTNAAHAIGGKPGTIKVEVRNCAIDAVEAMKVPDLRAGSYARLSVADSGRGMDAGTLARIFEAGFTTKRLGEGTGLGLAVVRNIMREHAGAISVASEPGEGSTFHLYFPAHASAVTGEASSPVEIQKGGGERILFVDDEPAICAGMAKTLQSLGYQVTTHTWPGLALAEFKARPGDFALTITNLNMPGMTGTEFAKELLKVRPELPILLTTGYCDATIREKCQNAGIRDVLTKPVLLPNLANLIHASLRPSAGASAGGNS